MRIAGRVLISIVTAILLFLIGILATAEINLSAHGVGAYDGDAGAKFALTIESFAMGAVLGLIGLVVGAWLSGRILPDSRSQDGTR